MSHSHQARRLSVLVVDDNPYVADTMVALLHLRGHRAVAAYDGPQAVRAAHRFPLDVVLLEMELPGIDGLEVARKIRAMPGCERTLLIAVGDYGSLEYQERVHAAGIPVYWAKPIKPADVLDFLDHLREILGERRPMPGVNRVAGAPAWPTEAVRLLLNAADEVRAEYYASLVEDIGRRRAVVNRHVREWGPRVAALASRVRSHVAATRAACRSRQVT